MNPESKRKLKTAARSAALGFVVGLPVGGLLSAGAFGLARSVEDLPALPGIEIRRPLPTPTPGPEIYYGYDPLQKECASNPKAVHENTEIKFREGAVVVGGVSVVVDNGEFLASNGEVNVRGKEIVLKIDRDTAISREYTLKVGEATYLGGEASTIEEFLKQPKEYSSVITGRCVPQSP